MHERRAPSEQSAFDLLTGELRFGRCRCSRGRRGQRLRRFNLPIASLFDARAEAAGLCTLLDDKRRAALGARLVDGLVRGGEIAIGITAAALE